MKIQNFLKNYAKISTRYPNVDIVVVTKYFTPEQTWFIIDQSKMMWLKDVSFWENRIQDSIQKSWILSKAHSHFIWRLQTNKVKKAVEIFDVIQSVDRFKLVIEIDKKSKELWIVQEIYLQINISGEEQKAWWMPDDFFQDYLKILELKNISVTWLMAMASKSEFWDVQSQFRLIKDMFDKCQNDNSKIKNLSLWMSSDYEMAIEEGATQVRLGRILFK